MIERKLKIRPKIVAAAVYETMKEAELFQNKILRPVIKMQHEILIAYIKHYLLAKNNMDLNSNDKIIAFISTSINKDRNFRSEIIGVIIGQFTVDEFLIYTKLSKEINKRIITIIKQRLENSLSIF